MKFPTLLTVYINGNNGISVFESFSQGIHSKELLSKKSTYEGRKLVPTAIIPQEQLRIEILLSPHFVGIELSSIIDVLRVANRVCGHERFTWQYTSSDGGDVEGAGGISVNTTDFSKSEGSPGILIVPGNRDNQFLNEKSIHRIRNMRRTGTLVILLSSAAAEIISHMRHATHPVTTHWENKSFLVEQDVHADVADTIFEQHGRLITAAGMTTTVDLMLGLITNYVPLTVVRAVSTIFLHNNIRPGNTHQPSQTAAAFAETDQVLKLAIKYMEEKLDTKVGMTQIANAAGVTTRSLERKFKKRFNITPARFLRELRLNKAHQLISESSMSLLDIALSCGFTDSNHMSNLYQIRYSIRPAELRKQSMVRSK